MDAGARPRLRGVFNEWAFFAAIGAAAPLLVLASGAREIVAVSLYAVALAAMFGASALYHRVAWQSLAVRAWMRRLDHSTIFFFIAATYTVFALLAFDGATTWIVLVAVWAGAAFGMFLSLVWIDAPKWLAAIVYLALGWAGVDRSARSRLGRGRGGRDAASDRWRALHARRRHIRAAPAESVACHAGIPRDLPRARDRRGGSPVRRGRARRRLAHEPVGGTAEAGIREGSASSPTW